MKVFNRKVCSSYGQLIIALLVLSAFESALAQNYVAQTRQQIAVESRLSLAQGLHQHNANTALLVSGLGNSFGIYRYDLATNRLELLEAVTPRPLHELSFLLPEAISFHTTDKLTFIDIRGRLYSSDGTVENTQFIRDFGVSFGGGSLGALEVSNIRGTHSIGEQLLFSADSGIDFDSTNRLFVSDGSPEGTKQIGSNFATIGEMFNFDNETFFFARKSETDNLQIWQVSENGTRLSKIVTGFAGFAGVFTGNPSSIAISGNTAYFCLGDQLASFSNKRLSFTSTISCDIGVSGARVGSHFEVNSSGVFFSNQGNIFKLNTQTLEASRIDISSVSSQPASIECSTNDSLLFTVTTESGRRSAEDGLLSYNTNSGLQQRGVTGSDIGFRDIVCLNDKAIVESSGFSIYKSELNSLQPIRSSSARLLFRFSRNLGPLNGPTVVNFNYKIYVLNITDVFGPDSPNVSTGIVEISERGPFPIIAPIISELLLEQERPDR